MGVVFGVAIKVVGRGEVREMWSKRSIGWFSWDLRLSKMMMVRKKTFESGRKSPVHLGLLWQGSDDTDESFWVEVQLAPSESALWGGWGHSGPSPVWRHWDMGKQAAASRGFRKSNSCLSRWREHSCLPYSEGYFYSPCWNNPTLCAA